tara:strand:- start:1007 stop:1255 length:249 start_codon:yes stop_codon:yes gene_type:complete
MKIRYFSWIKNITNIDIEEVDNKYIKDIESLKKFLTEKYPKLNEYLITNDIIQIAVNLEYTSKNISISTHDEVALFPPVSGG